MERRIQLGPEWCQLSGPMPQLPTSQLSHQSDLPNPVKPSHYKSGMDPYAYAMANDLGPLEMNILKYITRWKKKDGITDLKKAQETIARLIHYEENKF